MGNMMNDDEKADVKQIINNAQSYCPMLESKMEHVLVMEEEIMVRAIQLKDYLIFFLPWKILYRKYLLWRKLKIYHF